MNANALDQASLKQFTGTTEYFRHLSGYLYTEGVAYVAQTSGAYWLIDKIAWTTAGKPCLQKFGNWKLTVHNDRSATLTCEDGDKRELYREMIEYTDFPLRQIEIWLINHVLLLPSEY